MSFSGDSLFLNHSPNRYDSDNLYCEECNSTELTSMHTNIYECQCGWKGTPRNKLFRPKTLDCPRCKSLLLHEPYRYRRGSNDIAVLGSMSIHCIMCGYMADDPTVPAKKSQNKQKKFKCSRYKKYLYTRRNHD